MTFKYEEYEMAVEGAYDNVVLALNANEEIEIVECKVHIWISLLIKFAFESLA